MDIAQNDDVFERNYKKRNNRDQRERKTQLVVPKRPTGNVVFFVEPGGDCGQCCCYEYGPVGKRVADCPVNKVGDRCFLIQ